MEAQFSSVQSLSRVRLFATPWIAAHQASLSITNSRSALRLTSIESVMPSSPLILCRPLLLLPPIPPSIRVFSNESTLEAQMTPNSQSKNNTQLWMWLVIEARSNAVKSNIASDQISRSVVSDSLRPHESQHARPPCPSPTPGVHWDSHPPSQWCHLASGF